MIRQATQEDLPRIFELQLEVERESAIRGYHADCLAEWAERALAWTFVAELQNAVVGFIHASPRLQAAEQIFPPGSHVLEIVELHVTALHRGRGLGHELMARLREQARKDGFDHLRVYSAAKRFDDIVRFYRGCGFSPWYLELTAALDEP